MATQLSGITASKSMIESTTDKPRLMAVVDLGSNSFRLQVSKLVETSAGVQFRTIDSLKEPVRLAAGLTPDGRIDSLATERAMQTLLKFGERLRSFQPEAVRAVGTSTFRVAKNGDSLLRSAEAAIGFPIEIIAGREEARLIYAGASHELQSDSNNRLVIDIGGGSTECIIGRNHDPLMLESVLVGCVSISQRHFPDGAISVKRFDEAYYKARSRFESYAVAYRSLGWSYAVGTSGTAKAISQMCERVFRHSTIEQSDLVFFRDQLVHAGTTANIDLQGLKEDRRHVYAGGLAVMLAAFDEFEIDSMQYCNSALRHGLMYDLLDRKGPQDMREVTVLAMMRRYAIDEQHANQVASTACRLFRQAAKGSEEEIKEREQLLRWAALLADAGLTIAHEDFHKHSAYIISHVDMQGFSSSQQMALANLALGQTGGLRKLRDLNKSALDWITTISLRIAFILHRRRDNQAIPMPEMIYKSKGLQISVTEKWIKAHPLTHASLLAEIENLNELGVVGRVGLELKI